MAERAAMEGFLADNNVQVCCCCVELFLPAPLLPAPPPFRFFLWFTPSAAALRLLFSFVCLFGL